VKGTGEAGGTVAFKVEEVGESVFDGHFF